MRWKTTVLLASFLLACPAPSAIAAAAAAGSKHRLTEGQARQMVALVAKHDRIDLSDTRIELNSMDVNADFIPGFSSFIVIRESTTPGPDETLRRYAVNRSTGDVWEMTLCTHYSFSELEQMRAHFAGIRAAAPGEIAEQSRQLGCEEKAHSPTL